MSGKRDVVGEKYGYLRERENWKKKHKSGEIGGSAEWKICEEWWNKWSEERRERHKKRNFFSKGKKRRMSENLSRKLFFKTKLEKNKMKKRKGIIKFERRIKKERMHDKL